MKTIMSNNKIVFWTSYSDNNINVFNKSLPNHEQYCKLHNYDLINFKEPWNVCVDIQRVLNLLEKYEIVISFGTDIIIKRMNDSIEKYISDINGVTMCRQFHPLKDLNGDFIIYPKSEETYKILKLIDEIQQKLRLDRTK